MYVFLTGILITLVMLLLFGLTIFVHELGHFLAARRLGLVVEAFSIGFGPPVWQRRIGGVRYKIGAIPLGGYVALPQLDPTAMANVQGAEGRPSLPLPPVAPWRKILVALAGAAGNVVLAVLLALTVAALHPSATDAEARVGYVSPDSQAYEAGLRAGDRIELIGGQRVTAWGDFQVEAHLAAEGSMLRLGVRSAETSDEDPLMWIEVTVTNITEDLRGIEGVLPLGRSIVTAVASNSPAMRAGVEPGDEIVSIDDVPVAGMQHVIEMVEARGETPLALRLLRKGTPLMIEVTPRFDAEHGRALMGVGLAEAQGTPSMWMTHRHPARQLLGDVRGIVRLLRSLVAPREPGETGRAAGSLGGPLIILVTLWVSVRENLLDSIGFIRFLNVNLAILNLLPIPVLDGGHILFALYELVTRRRPNPRLVNALVNVFVVLLLIGVLLITRNDVRRLWRVFVQREVVAEAVVAPEDQPGEFDGTETENP